MTRLLSLYTVQVPWTLVYMLQQVEYSPSKFLGWFFTFPNLFLLQKRGRLKLTARVKLMLIVAYAIWSVGFIQISFLALWLQATWIFLGLLLLPFYCALGIFVFSSLLQLLIVTPRQKNHINRAKQKLQSHQATRIAVLGSYGKTSMKELLVTVLSEAKNVAATPGNKNVLISHAGWVNQNLKGDEEVLVFEYGEAGPGDIAKLAAFSSPQIAVVTGIAPAHLDAYPSLEAIAKDFASINEFVKSENAYVHAATLLKTHVKGQYYDEAGLADWKASNIKVDFSGTSFTLRHKTKTLKLKSGLLGRHQVGPLTAVAAIAQAFGLSDKQITAGIAKTKPFEHRMQPRHLPGAWILDDTYNGNIEGVRAGLVLLKELPAKRKIYVTPGLVDQGVETKNVHKEMGQLIASTQPDQVVLMQNSATEFIQAGLQEHRFKGEVKLEDNPLEYYTNLEHYLAAGDVVMLQNDWPDSYR